MSEDEAEQLATNGALGRPSVVRTTVPGRS
jgi:hypothetical protein